MTREDEDFKAAFMADPINLQTIPKFNELHLRDSDFYNPDKSMDRRNPRNASNASRTPRAQNARDRQHSRSTSSSKPRKASRFQPAEKAKELSPTVLALQTIVDEANSRPGSTIGSLTQSTALTDFGSLFYKSPFADTASVEGGDTQGEKKLELDVDSYDQYRLVQEGHVAVDSVVPNARLLVSRHRNLDLESRRKALEIVERYATQGTY